jgi:hypothetical protein
MAGQKFKFEISQSASRAEKSGLWHKLDIPTLSINVRFRKADITALPSGRSLQVPAG